MRENYITKRYLHIHTHTHTHIHIHTHKKKNRPPSLLASRRALFLAQLYGLRDRIDRKKVSDFVLSVSESVGWVGWTDAKENSKLSDVETVHAAVRCLQVCLFMCVCMCIYIYVCVHVYMFVVYMYVFM